jgi:hypothetical protein
MGVVAPGERKKKMQRKRFIDKSELGRHVSANNFAHLQEH